MRQVTRSFVATFISAAILLVVTNLTMAQWSLVEDFSGCTAGPLDGQTAANGQSWTAHSNFDVAELAGNLVFQGTNATSQERAFLPLASSLSTGTTWTLFYRVRFEDIGGVSGDPVAFDFDAGPSDSTAPAVFNDKTHSFRVKWQEMRFSNTGSPSGQTAPWEIQEDVWYNVWHVLDLADDANPQLNDTSRAYIQGGSITQQEQGIDDSASGAAQTDLGFRDYAGGPMEAFYTMMGGRGGMGPIAYIDDIYIGGGDLHGSNPIPEPSMGILLASLVLMLGAKNVFHPFLHGNRN